MINAYSTAALWKEWTKQHHLRFGQPIVIAHMSPELEAMNHAATSVSSRLMGPNPSGSWSVHITFNHNDTYVSTVRAVYRLRVVVVLH